MDAKGVPCPIPLLKLKKALVENKNKLIEIHVTDQGALKDIPAFCDLKTIDCELVSSGKEIVFLIDWGNS